MIARILSKRRLAITVPLVIVIVAIALVYLVINRRFTPNTSDDSIISGIPCAPPCWQGLVPGQSTKSDVRDFLETSDLIPNRTIQEWERSPNALGWFWSRDHNGRFKFRYDQALKSMSIHPNFEFSVEDILAIYGEPAGTRSYLAAVGNEGEFEVRLYFPQHGLVTTFIFATEPVQDDALIPFTGDILGDRFDLYEPADTLEQFIAGIYSFDEAEATRMIADYFTVGWWGLDARLLRKIEGTPAFTYVFVTMTPEATGD